MSEDELQAKLAGYLSRYFIVEREVWSIDHKKRIDIAMFHKTDISKDYPVGIEVKTDDKKTGSLLAGWLNQAVIYCEKEFVGFGKLMVCTYPQITEKYLSEGDLMSKHDVWQSGSLACQNNVHTFLGGFNIGELQRYKFNSREYLRIVFNSWQIWDSVYDDFRFTTYIRCKR